MIIFEWCSLFEMLNFNFCFFIWWLNIMVELYSGQKVIVIGILLNWLFMILCYVRQCSGQVCVLFLIIMVIIGLWFINCVLFWVVMNVGLVKVGILFLGGLFDKILIQFLIEVLVKFVFGYLNCQNVGFVWVVIVVSDSIVVVIIFWKICCIVFFFWDKFVKLGD